MAYLRPTMLLAVILCGSACFAADWNQWRGPGRDGSADDSVSLITALPEGGLPPLWLSEGKIAGGGDGGWSSPLVAEGRVYLFSHFRTPGGRQEEPKYPRLSEEEQAGHSPEELQEYERLRNEEEQQRRRNQPHDEIIYCFDSEKGQVLWKNAHKSVHTGTPHSGTPAVVGGKLFVLSAGMIARCLDASTGESLWQTRLPAPFDYESVDSSFAVAENVAVILAGQLFGLDVSSGKLLWQGGMRKHRGRRSSPVVWRTGERELIIANVSGGDTVCVDPQTGSELWRVKSEADNSTPVVAGDRLITFGNSRKKGLRSFLMSQTGAEHQWTWQGAADPGSSPVVAGDLVFVQGEQRVGCVDLLTGDEAWRDELDLPNPRYTSPIAADGKVLYTYDGVLIFSASREQFEPLISAKIDGAGILRDRADTQIKGARQPLECSSPAIADGRLYLRLKEAVACYDLRASK